MQKVIEGADLFCGAGGTSTGLDIACKEKGYTLKLLAINHWNVAIATHTKNHPGATHLCENLDNVTPEKAVPSKYLDILVASPECTHHSNARGGRPMSDQSRASAWHVLRWASSIDVRNILIENVREFINWGPLGADGRPLKSKKGALFKQLINSLIALNYKVDYKVLNAADYGDPTSRRRLFIIARKGKKIVWPNPTHTPNGDNTLYGKTFKWRAAREIIDWNIPGKSIFERKKPLSENTMRRIIAGIRKFSGKELEPFLVKLYKTSNAADIDKPCPTLTTIPKIALCQPFVMRTSHKKWDSARCHSVEKPLPTIVAAQTDLGICEPYLVEFYGNGKPRSIDKPLPTQGTKDRFGIVEPFILGIAHSGAKENAIRSIDQPLPVIMTKEELAVCEPFLVEFHGGKDGEGRIKSVENPLPTQGCSNAFALCRPFIVPNFGERKTQSP